MRKYVTSSEEETKKIAQTLSQKIKRGVIALTGELGTGKTTFVQGFAQALGIKEKIISPTFIIVRQHKIPGTKKPLYHIDLYRLDDEKQVKDLGLENLTADPKNLILIEWAEKAKGLLPKNTVWLYFEKLGQQKRSITLV